jgi:hypothetical protein
MADPAPKKYSQQNYWRYIFAPMFMIVIGFGLYILFTMNDSQSMSLDSVTKQVNSMSGITNMENALPGNSRQMVLQKGRTNIYEELNN